MLFLQIQSINIVYPNVKNMIAVPRTKRIEIIMSFQVRLILRMNFDFKENSGKKNFLAFLKHQYRVSQYGEYSYSAHHSKNEDCYEYGSFSRFTSETLIT